MCLIGLRGCNTFTAVGTSLLAHLAHTSYGTASCYTSYGRAPSQLAHTHTCATFPGLPASSSSCSSCSVCGSWQVHMAPAMRCSGDPAFQAEAGSRAKTSGHADLQQLASRMDESNPASHLGCREPLECVRASTRLRGGRTSLAAAGVASRAHWSASQRLGPQGRRTASQCKVCMNAI